MRIRAKVVTGEAVVSRLSDGAKFVVPTYALTMATMKGIMASLEEGAAEGKREAILAIKGASGMGDSDEMGILIY